MVKIKKGFTIVELLIYIGILSILLIVLTDIFVAILDVRRESQATSAVEEDGRFILGRIAYDFYQAQNVNLTAGQTDTRIEFNIQGSGIRYSLNAGNFLRAGDPNCDLLGSECPLNSSESKITSLTFTNIKNSFPPPNPKDTIQVKFTVESVAQRPQGPETRSFQTTIGLR